jgi:hypothetical protein
MLEGPLPLPARITLQAMPLGTRLRFEVYGEPQGAMRVAQPLLRFTLNRQFARSCAMLKRALEEAPHPG